MSILFAGCSFTNGMELPDKKVQRFSALVAKEFGVHEWNEAKVGAGNDYIQRVVTNAIVGNKKYYSVDPSKVKTDVSVWTTSPEPVDKNDKGTGWLINQMGYDTEKGRYSQVKQQQREVEKIGTPNLVVCMWSGINRHETLRKSKVTNDWSWTIGTWGAYLLDPKTLKALKGSKPYVDRQHPVIDRRYLEGYMERVRNAHFSLRLTIGNMLAVKYLLDAKGINQLHYLFSHGQYRPLLPILDWEIYEQNNFWWDSLDLNRKQIVEELPFLESEGFYDMCLRQNLKIGKRDHPLEEAHRQMAVRIISDIKTNEFNKKFN